MNFIEALEVSHSLYHPDYGNLRIISVDFDALEVFMEDDDSDEITVPIDKLKDATLYTLEEIEYDKI